MSVKNVLRYKKLQQSKMTYKQFMDFWGLPMIPNVDVFYKEFEINFFHNGFWTNLDSKGGKGIDYFKDYKLIVMAFMSSYRINMHELEQLSWFEFMYYLEGIMLTDNALTPILQARNYHKKKNDSREYAQSQYELRARYKEVT